MIVYIQHLKNSINPIHLSLHEAMKERVREVRYFELAFTPLRSAIIYIHFPDSCFFTESSWKMLVKFSVFMLSILWSRFSGSRIVWEVNNLRSHERRFPLFESILMAVFVRSISGVIHLSKSSACEAPKLYPTLKEKPSIIIPHPNFRHLYPKRGEPERGRRILGVEKGNTVLMAFGLIRRYKGTKELVEQFKKIEGPALRLAVAGRPADPAYAREIQDAAQSDTRIRLIFREILDEELPDLFAAVALNCATFRAILNSGSAILALSFACPVIAPRLGSLRNLEELVGANWVMLYDGELNPEILCKAISWARKDRSSVPALGFCDIEKITTDTLAFLEKVQTN